MDQNIFLNNSFINVTSEEPDEILTFTPFIWPPSLTSNLGMFFLSLLSILGNAGGIGGAGVNIPFMMIFFGLPIKECVPLAQIFGLIAALVRFFVNYKENHPNNERRTVIDYEIVTLSMPMLYLGTLLGVRIG